VAEKNVVVQAWAGPIRAGDTLIIGFTGRCTTQDAALVRERFADLAPGVIVVVLDNVAQLAVYRPDGGLNS